MLEEPLRHIPGMDPNEAIDPIFTIDQLNEFGWAHGLPKHILLRRVVENVDAYAKHRPRPPSHYLNQRRVWRRSILLRIIDGEWTQRQARRGRPRKDAKPTPLAEQQTSTAAE